MINILIIGLGSIAKKHILAIEKVWPNAKLFALRTKESDTFQNIIQFTNYTQINVMLDLIIISNPTYLHYETIENCVQFNCPILVEKPVLMSVKNSEILLEKVKNIKTYVACNLRFHPCIVFLKSYFAENKVKVNEVSIYCGSYLPNWRENTNFRENYSANSAMGGGVHLDLIHEIDYCTWIWGMPNANSSFKTSVSSLNIDSVDCAHYVLKYSGFIASINLNYFRVKPKREIEILFENDIWKVDLLAAKITNSNNETVFENNEFQISDTYIKQIAYIKQCIEQKKPFMNSIAEALPILKICNDE